MIKRLTDHVLSLIAAVVAIAGFISLLTSQSVERWVKGHSLWVFAGFIISIALTFIVVDYVTSRKGAEATEHDRIRVAHVLMDLPPDGPTIAWLKQGTVWNTLPYHVIEVLDKVLQDMELDVLGLDNRQANEAYVSLQRALEDFRSFVSLNLFMRDNNNRDYTRMSLSSEWSEEHRNEAADKIDALQAVAVRAYDNFLTVCHKKRLN